MPRGFALGQDQMEDGLPSYEAAVTKDYWPLVGEYVQSKDLCSVALVSKRLNKIFTSYLWGNPASHFNAQDDAVYGTDYV